MSTATIGIGSLASTLSSVPTPLKVCVGLVAVATLVYVVARFVLDHAERILKPLICFAIVGVGIGLIYLFRAHAWSAPLSHAENTQAALAAQQALFQHQQATMQAQILFDQQQQAALQAHAMQQLFVDQQIATQAAQAAAQPVFFPPAFP